MQSCTYVSILDALIPPLRNCNRTCQLRIFGVSPMCVALLWSILHFCIQIRFSSRIWYWCTTAVQLSWKEWEWMLFGGVIYSPQSPRSFSLLTAATPRCRRSISSLSSDCPTWIWHRKPINSNMSVYSSIRIVVTICLSTCLLESVLSFQERYLPYRSSFPNVRDGSISSRCSVASPLIVRSYQKYDKRFYSLSSTTC